MKFLLLITCLISFLSKGFGQETQSQIDKKDLRQIINILTSDSLGGRGTASEGQKKAERYISDSFKKLGLSPYNQNGYLEKFELKQTYWDQVYIETPNMKLNNFDKIVFQGNTNQNREVEKEVVFGGMGTDEELNKIDVTDRFVLVFIKNLRATSEISRKLEKKKAFGVILANPENDKQFESIKRTFKDFSLAKRFSLLSNENITKRRAEWDTIRFTNSILIPNSQIKNISGLSINKLKKLIESNKITDAPIVKVKTKFEKVIKKLETANVIGVIKGKTNKTIVISAHYDHLGVIDASYFPGADDNASGVAALLELAELFSTSENLDFNIMFLATSAEEAGLLGSSYHVNNVAFNPKNIICNINLDMISRSDEKHVSKDYLYCIGSDQSNSLDELIKNADIAYDKCHFDYSLNNSKDPMGIFTRSDNYSFYKKGVPAIFFFSGLHADYHKITDTANKIDYKNLEHRVEQISKVIELLESGGFKN